jgi:hypothetical protein
MTVLHAPLLQKLLDLFLTVALDHHVPRQTVDRDFLVWLDQESSQLVPQRYQISRDLAHGGEAQIATALVVGVDGQVFGRGPRDVVFWWAEGGGCCGGSKCLEGFRP